MIESDGKVVFEPLLPDVVVPSRETEEAAGYDVRAYLVDRDVRMRLGNSGEICERRADSGRLTLEPGDIALVPTGFKARVPVGYEAQVRPRSGLAVKKGIGIINSPGTIDADYRGEIKVALINLGQAPVTIHRCDRIAQMVINRVSQVRLKVVPSLDETDRNSGGFGHTGV